MTATYTILYMMLYTGIVWERGELSCRDSAPWTGNMDHYVVDVALLLARLINRQVEVFCSFGRCSPKQKAKLYFNEQSQVNQCTLENKYIYNLQNGHCGRHQKTNLCLFRMSPFYGRHNK